MYAIVKTGGKQYKVSPGDTLKVEKIEGEPGQEIIFDNVLMVVDDDNNTEIGNPLITDVKVSGLITKQTKGEKIIVFKFKRRKGYRNKNGHRQKLTEITIKDIIK
jgi:large subunit ribosomal protein L21